MELRLSLRYQGPAVESGEMDVYEAATNMVAFSDFMVASAKEAYGESAFVKANVIGIGKGSFVTDLAINVLGPAATIFSTISPDKFIDLLKEAFDLWKFLKGKPPTKVVNVSDKGQQIEVVNNNGQITQVHADSLNIVFNEKATDAVERFIRSPLSREGIDSVEIADKDKKVIGQVKQGESKFFVSVRPEEKITESEIEMALIVEAPVFKDELKWRFSDGQNSFLADIDDREFLARVDQGELFGKGDILLVKLRITQMRSGAKISAQRSVVKVLDHKHGQEQKNLFS